MRVVQEKMWSIYWSCEEFERDRWVLADEVS